MGQDDPCEGTTTPTPITTTSGLARLCPDGWEDGGLGHCYIFLDHRDNFENAKNMWVSGLMIDMMLPCECGALSDDCDKRYKHYRCSEKNATLVDVFEDIFENQLVSNIS